jgi:aryl-alcohol dehydrogenase-like predicted oxidoreductase
MIRGETPYETLDAALARGINTFDTAASYGESEAALGRWIASRNIRDQVVVLTKGCARNKWRHRTTAFDLRSDFEDSLARLGVDSIDIYILHRDHPDADVGAIMETLNLLRREGRVGIFGASNWTHERISLANRYAEERGLVPFTAASPAYSLAEMLFDPFEGSFSLNGEKNRQARAWFQSQKTPIFAYSSLARGLLSGKIRSDESRQASQLLNPTTVKEYAYPPNFERLRRAETLAAEKGCAVSAVAIAWLLHSPLDVHPIISPGSVRHLDQALEALDVALTEREIRWLNLDQD